MILVKFTRLVLLTLLKDTVLPPKMTTLANLKTFAVLVILIVLKEANVLA